MNAEELTKALYDARYANIKLILEKAGWPDKICSQEVLSSQTENKNSMRGDLNKGMAQFGYGVLKNEKSKDGRWKIGGKNATMYFKLPSRAE